MDEHEDADACVGSADADVVQAAGVAQGEFSELVDAVGAHPVVGVAAFARGGFGPGGVGGGRGCAVGQFAVRAATVVDLGEGVELGL
ncbi:MAG TPA: hypothetical protein VG074_00915 [Acidimicrobiales bacterium]|nr:hypothetical protein [Acidimicrobiales bacterium]